MKGFILYIRKDLWDQHSKYFTLLSIIILTSAICFFSFIHGLIEICRNKRQQEINAVSLKIDIGFSNTEAKENFINVHKKHLQNLSTYYFWYHHEWRILNNKGNFNAFPYSGRTINLEEPSFKIFEEGSKINFVEEKVENERVQQSGIIITQSLLKRLQFKKVPEKLLIQITGKKKYLFRITLLKVIPSISSYDFYISQNLHQTIEKVLEQEKETEKFVSIYVKNYYNFPTCLSHLELLGEGSDLTTYSRDVIESFIEFSGFLNIGVWFLIIIFLILMSAFVVSITTGHVTRKRRSIGILKSMGANPWRIVSIFVLKDFFITFFSCILGLSLSLFFSCLLFQSIYLQKILLNFQVRLSQEDAFAFISYLKSYGLYFFVIVIVSCISTIYCSKKYVCKNIQDLLK